MIRRTRKRKCRHCKTFFTPDPRNAHHQNYCGRQECRKASKKGSQRRWLSKPENKNYFSGPQNVERVRQWRENHPGYWRVRTSCNPDALQDVLCENQQQNQLVNINFVQPVLQDLFIEQEPVLIGLIAQLTGCALQDDIALAIRRMQQLGRDILYPSHQSKGGQHAQTSHLSATHPAGPQTVQLGGSPAGP
jgi:hypothetical protein